jgi:hypothetical protein
MTTEHPAAAASIFSLLQALSQILDEASGLAILAAEELARDFTLTNLAIGTILPLQDMLPTALALCDAACALHRLPRKGGAQ